MPELAKVAIVFHSGFGHTEAVARSIAAGVEQSTVATAVLSPVAELGEPADSVAAWEVLHQADAIVFGSPTYMGSVSGPFKAFMDRSSAAWAKQLWRDKLAAGFTNAGALDGDKRNTLTTLHVFAAQHNMLWVPAGFTTAEPEGINRLGSFGGLMTQSDNGPADSTPPKEDHASAQRFGAHIAQTAARWAHSSA